MEVKVRADSLRMTFFKFIASAGIAVCIVAAILIVSMSYYIDNSGFILPANYSEKLAMKSKDTLSKASEITPDKIPEGSEYALIDKNYRIIESDIDPKLLNNVVEHVKSDDKQDNSINHNDFLYQIDRKDGYLVLKYTLESRYKSETLNRVLPKSDNVILAVWVILEAVTVIAVAIYFANRLKRNLEPLIRATDKIREQDLEFEIEKTKIEEFNDVIYSLDELKVELKKSLEEQWRVEESKKEQVSSLAHDIKTPITIIKGNSELLLESELAEDQQLYLKYILKNSNQIEAYLKKLIEISQEGKGDEIYIEKVNSSEFLKDINDQIIAMCNTNNLQLHLKEKDVPEELYLDRDLLSRAIMNLVSNAVDYSSQSSILTFSVRKMVSEDEEDSKKVGSEENRQGNKGSKEGRKKVGKEYAKKGSNEGSREDFIEFAVEDSGSGFSEKNIAHATKQFYMGDSSRNSKMHYGMGLYIAKSISVKHGGDLYVSNSKTTGGGLVSIRIPIRKIKSQ
jgi:signal transduction histidine kinase